MEARQDNPRRDVTSNAVLFGIVLFAILSIYFTQKGFALIWPGSTSFVEYVLPWAFAIALGVVQYGLLVRLGRTYLNENRFKLAIAYVLLAMVSIFFNFNAIYSDMAAPELQARSADDFRSKFVKIKNEARGQMRTHFGVDSLAQEVLIQQAALDNEVNHFLTPGQGPRAQRLKVRLGTTRARSDAARSLFAESEFKLNQVRLMQYDTLQYARDVSYARLIEEDAVQKMSEVVALGTPYGFIPSEQVNVIAASRMDTRSLEFSLLTVIDVVRSTVTGRTSGITAYRVILAGVFGTIIDFAAFIPVLMLGMAGKEDGRRQPRERAMSRNGTSMSRNPFSLES